jgi:hypothetical protein
LIWIKPCKICCRSAAIQASVLASTNLRLESSEEW